MAALIVLPVFAGSKKQPRQRHEEWKTGANERKADYYYMEAMRQNALGNDDAFFDLLSTAWELDSTDTGPGMTLGYYMMVLGGNSDSVYSKRGYDMVRKHFETHPSDYYGAIFYGMINDRLGNTDESVRVWHTLDSLNPTNPDVQLRYAEALLNVADTASLLKSIDVVNRVQRAEGIDLGLTTHKVRARMSLGDTAGVFAELEEYRLKSPRDPDYYIYTGEVYNAYNMADSARANFDRACSVDSTCGRAFYRRAMYLKDQGDSIGYDRELYKAMLMESLDLDVKLDMLAGFIRDAYTDSLQRPRIERLLDVLVEQNPHEPKVRDLYASYLLALNKPNQAAEQQEIAIDADPSDKSHWTSTISLYGQADNNDKALQLSDRALEYFPGDPVLSMLKANTLQQMNRWDEAIVVARKGLAGIAADDNATRSNVLALIGDSYHQLGQPDSAFAYYERALTEYPDNFLAANNFAYYLAVEGKDLDRAERLSAMSMRGQPDNDTFLDTYAWILFRKNDYVHAKEFIDKALEIEGENAQADVLHHAGDIYYMNGDPEQALKYWEQALKLDPDNDLLKKKVKHKTHFFE